MKNIKSMFLYSMLSFLIVFSISSCKKNDEGHGAPVITRIRTVFHSNDTTTTITPFDSTTNDGKIGTLYAIIGNNLSTTKQILINGVSIYFNIAYVSNTTLQFTVPDVVPFSNANTNNTLTVVNDYGKATYPFVIEQPFPSINTVSQLAGNAGDIITITGTTFVGVSKVAFGTVAGTIVTNTSTVLTVKVPAGVTDGLIRVTTVATKGGGTATGPTLLSGTSKLTNNVSATHQATGIFGFETAIYEDSFENGWYDYGWGNSPKTDNTLFKRGTNSIKVSYAGGYDGFVFGGNNENISQYGAIKFSLYGGKGTGGKLVQVTLNGTDNNHAVQISLVEGQWTDYIIPAANFADAAKPAPTFINSIVFQEYSGVASSFNIDDVGIVDVPPTK